MIPVDRAGPISEISTRFRRVRMRGWAGSVAEVSVIPTEISATGMKIFPYDHSISVTGTKQNSSPFDTVRPKWHNFALYVFLLQKYSNFPC